MTIWIRKSLIILLILQLFLTLGYELAHDEAYYWIFSHHLSWGYFDHPPMMALVIKFFSFLPQSELSVRAGFLVLQTLTVLVLLKLIPPKHHLTSVLLFFSFPLASFSGLFALPDMPLLFATSLYFLFLKDFLDEKPYSVLKLGLIIPILLYSKYHGILLIFFTILALPKILFKRDFWLVAIISVVLFSPHIWWQYLHEFATLKYHFLERPKANFSLKRLFEYVGLQVGLAGIFVGPIVWWIVARVQPQDKFEKVLKWNSLGVVIFFLISTLSKKFEANWTIFLTIPLIILVANSDYWNRKSIRILLVISFTIVMSSRLLLILPVENKLTRLKEFHGWKNWAQVIQEKCGQERKILTNSYQYASKLSFYLNQEIHALNYHSRKNQFDYWNYASDYSTKELCYITDKQQFTGNEVVTPDGKSLKIVFGLKLEELLNLKLKN